MFGGREDTIIIKCIPPACQQAEQWSNGKKLTRALSRRHDGLWIWWPLGQIKRRFGVTFIDPDDLGSRALLQQWAKKPGSVDPVGRCNVG